MQRVKQWKDRFREVIMIITREFLAQYVYLDSYIKSIRRRLKYFETHPILAEHGVVSGSMKNFPYAQCHFVVSGSRVKSDEERKKIVSQLMIDLRGNEQIYEDMKLDIEMFIESLDSIEDKAIMRLKYIDKLTDERIGAELGYDRSTISKKIDRIIGKNELSHNSHS